MLAIGPLQAHYTQQAATSVNNFSNTIAASINASMYNQSAAYASSINTRVDNIQSTVNNGLFGWVNGTTTQLNTTINTFYSDIQNAVDTVFNNTVLDAPMQEFLRCILGTKVDAIENALTFLHDNLRVDVPRVNDTVLVLSPESVKEATQPIAQAAIGGTNGDTDDKGLVGRLVDSYVSALKKERIMFGIFMGLWGVVVLMALCIIFWHSYGRDWVEAYKKRKWQREQRAGIEGVVVPFRNIGHGRAGSSTSRDEKSQDGHDEAAHPRVDLPTFTPLPSPKPKYFSGLKSPVYPDSNRLQPPLQHPLNNRNSAFQRSWESLMDQANPIAPASESKPYKISAPMKLMAMRSRSSEDEEKAGASERESGTWLGRFTSAFWKREQAKQEQQPVAGPSSPPSITSSMTERPRPQLTIAVPPSIDEEPEPVSADPSRPTRQSTLETPVPTSAWSVSPRKHSWLPSIPTLKPLYRKSRPAASIPSDVHSTADSYGVPLRRTMRSTMQFAVPLHHGFEHPVPPTITPPSPPPMISPVYGQVTPREDQDYTSPTVFSRQSQIPLIFRAQHPHNLMMTQPTQQPRRSTQVVNPFATPFDDEHGVVEPSPPYISHSSARKSNSTNPFIVM